MYDATPLHVHLIYSPEAPLDVWYQMSNSFGECSKSNPPESNPTMPRVLETLEVGSEHRCVPLHPSRGTPLSAPWRDLAHASPPVRFAVTWLTFLRFFNVYITKTGAKVSFSRLRPASKRHYWRALRGATIAGSSHPAGSEHSPPPNSQDFHIVLHAIQHFSAFLKIYKFL